MSLRLENADSILSETDRMLKQENPPDLEYLFVAPFITHYIPGTNYGVCFNIYGHTAIRYRDPDTQSDVVMNIQGKEENADGTEKIIHYHTPEDYLFSDKASQGGVFSRQIISVRFYDIPDEKLRKLHQYYQEVDRKRGKFDMILFPL